MVDATKKTSDVVILTGNSVNSLCVVSLVFSAKAPDRPVFSNRTIGGKEYYHLTEDSIKPLIATPEKLQGALLILDRAYAVVSGLSPLNAATIFFEHLLAQYRHYELVALITTEDPKYIGRRAARMSSCSAIGVEGPIGTICVDYRPHIPRGHFVQTIDEAKFLTASKLSYDANEVPSFWTDVSSILD